MIKLLKKGEATMVHTDEVNQQLRRIGANFRFWNRPEVRELPKILFESEQLHNVVGGRYEGGFAMLCATDRRVLLIDKKPLYLTLEDMRYDMISDVQFSHRLLDATIRLGAVTKMLTFTGYNPTKLRDLTNFVQQQVMHSRQHQSWSPDAPALQAAGLDSTDEQLPADPIPVQALLSENQPQALVNPYKMPVMIRRRVSRFY
ncbi:MAG TPA: PH domain-containing protein [Candidatus Saccharimonadales bacterium]|nr:PH domain-containing protein [Candidatus Saccharimonadales bacterium]